MKFLLDTDTCIYAIKQEHMVLDRLLSHPPPDIAIGVITEAELRTGAALSAKMTASPIKTLRAIERFLRPLEIVEFNSADAVAYSEVRAKLERVGLTIGPLDMLIAAQAMSRNLVLVSNNEKEFGRVAGLRVENWRLASERRS